MTDHALGDEDLPADPAELLPDNSALSLDEYLEMYAAVGHRIRYEILYRLVYGVETTPTELREALEINDSTLTDHLNTLQEVGLIEKRQQTDRGQDELQTYYQATVFGELLFTTGINDLIRGEQEFEAMYDSSSPQSDQDG